MSLSVVSPDSSLVACARDDCCCLGEKQGQENRTKIFQATLSLGQKSTGLLDTCWTAKYGPENRFNRFSCLALVSLEHSCSLRTWKP